MDVGGSEFTTKVAGHTHSHTHTHTHTHTQCTINYAFTLKNMEGFEKLGCGTAILL